MKNLKILIVSSAAPLRGGVSSHIEALTSMLAKANYKTDIVSLAKPKNKKGFGYASSGFIKIMSYFLKNKIAFWLSLLCARVVLYSKVAFKFTNNKYDVIHVHDINAFMAVYHLAKRKSIKIVLSLHGHMKDSNTSLGKIPSDTLLGRYLIRLEKNAILNADAVVTVSNHSYDIVKNYCQNRKLWLIPNFIDCEFYKPADEREKISLREKHNMDKDKLIVLYAGRLAESKGLQYIVEGVTKCNIKEKISLFLIGEGPMREQLNKYIKENNLNHIVTLNGEITDKNTLAEMYRASDAFIIASTSEGPIEGTPLAVIEAISCGLALISTPVGGLNDILLNIEKSFMISEKSSDSVADILELIGTKDDTLKFAASASSDAAKKYYSDAQALRNIIKIYES